MVPADPVTGEGYTMGALYWQLNDIWQGASWSSLEHGGGWKMAHYYAERFFAPTLLSAIISGDIVEVWAVCDAPTSPLTLSTTALSWTSFTPTNTSLVEVAGCPGPGAHLQLEVALADLLSWGGCHPGSYDHQRLAYCLLTFHIQEGAGLPLSTSHLLEAPKALNDPTFGLQEPNLRVTVTGRVNRITEGPYVESYGLLVEGDHPAIFVWLEAPGLQGRFTDNGFHLTESQQEVVFLAKEVTSAEELQAAVTVRAYTVTHCSVAGQCTFQ